MTEKTKENLDVGNRIRELRENANYTRENFAEKADISSQFLADIETGRKSMTVRTLKNIASALHTTTDYLVFGEVSPSHLLWQASPLLLMIEQLSFVEQYYLGEIMNTFINAMKWADKKDSEEPPG